MQYVPGELNYSLVFTYVGCHIFTLCVLNCVCVLVGMTPLQIKYALQLPNHKSNKS